MRLRYTREGEVAPQDAPVTVWREDDRDEHARDMTALRVA